MGRSNLYRSHFSQYYNIYTRLAGCQWVNGIFWLFGSRLALWGEMHQELGSHPHDLSWFAYRNFRLPRRFADTTDSLFRWGVHWQPSLTALIDLRSTRDHFLQATASLHIFPPRIRLTCSASLSIVTIPSDSIHSNSDHLYNHVLLSPPSRPLLTSLHSDVVLQVGGFLCRDLFNVTVVTVDHFVATCSSIATHPSCALTWTFDKIAGPSPGKFWLSMCKSTKCPNLMHDCSCF